MRKTVVFAGVALAGLASLLPGAALAQVGAKGAVYAFHTGKIGDCPGLDWYVTVEPGNKIIGMVSWDQATHTATLAGTLQPDGKFAMDAKEVGGSRTAKVTGSATGDYATLTITGTNGRCDGKTVQVPRAGTGYGGGG